jgi:hypothetical protein
MKRHFGTLFTRFLWGGTTLTKTEHAMLVELVKQLPIALQKTVNSQFQAYNLVQREINGRTLNFYRKLHGKSNNMDGLPLLEMKKDEAPLIGLTVRFQHNGQVLHVTLTAVHGRVFSINFDCRPPRVSTGLLFTVEKVRPSWKSDFIVPEE